MVASRQFQLFIVAAVPLVTFFSLPCCFAEEEEEEKHPAIEQTVFQQEREALHTNSLQRFSPETREFKVLMPAPVLEKNVDRGGIKFATYHSRKEGCDYSVNGGICLSGTFSYQAFLFGYEASIKRSNTSINIEELPAAGSGWSGKRLSIKENGKETSSALVCSATSYPVIYELRISAPANSQESKQFFNSFEVDNAILPQFYKQSKSDRLGTVLAQVGPYLLIGCGVIFAVISVIVAIVVVVLLRKRKKQELE